MRRKRFVFAPRGVVSRTRMSHVPAPVGEAETSTVEPPERDQVPEKVSGEGVLRGWWRRGERRIRGEGICHAVSVNGRLLDQIL